MVDIDNGELRDEDQKFIENLHLPESRLLIVFNKAGLVPPDKARAVIENVRARLEDSQLKQTLYGVIAYDSRSEETIVGGNMLEQFLSQVNQDSVTHLSVYDQFAQLGKEIVQDIKEQVQKEKDKIEQMENTIADAVDTGRIQSLINECVHSRGRKQNLLEAKRVLVKYFSEN